MGNTLVQLKKVQHESMAVFVVLGAGAGNTQTEVLVAVLEKIGIKTGIDLYKMMDIAEELLHRFCKNHKKLHVIALSLGYAGVYSSFLLHAQKAAEKFGVDSR